MEGVYTGDPHSFDPEKDFNGELKGSCLCGSVHVTLHDPDLFKGRRGTLCHYANSRKASGSVFSANVMVPADKVIIDDRNGTVKKYEDYATGSGKPVIRSFCSTCGCSLNSRTPLWPDVVIVKMGMFPRVPEPKSEAFSMHRQPWQPEHDGVKSDGGPNEAMLKYLKSL